MNPILRALGSAFRDVFQLNALWIAIWPMLAAVALWLVLGIAFWGTFSGWITTALVALDIQPWLEGVEPRWIANAIQAVLHFMVFVPAVFVTALVITALFAMPALIRLVADRDYPWLRRENGGNITANLLNALFSVAIFIAIWTLTLPLWLLGAGVIIPFVAAAYLNQRLFRFDALAEHASQEEMHILFSKYRSSWWVLGLLTGFIQFIPLLNLLAPVVTALVFIRFGLARLAELRSASPAVS